MPAIRLLNLLNILRKLPPLSELSGDQERMLFALRELYEQKESLSVSDVYGLIASQSATTSFRQLVALKEAGLVDIAVSATDRRLRVVTFTQKAEDFFRTLN